MRRTIASAAALALVGAATASADSHTYRGAIKGDARADVELEVKARGGRRAVTEFTVRRLPLECEGGTLARLRRATLEGRAPVTRKGRFRLAASTATQRLRLAGRLRGRDDATGTLRYAGLTEFPGQALDCRARGLRWAASR